MGFGRVFDSVFAVWGRVLAPWFWLAVVTAILTFVMGLWFASWIGRRRFNRRNTAGVEEYRGYGHALGADLAESVVDVISGVFLFIGAIATLVAIAAWIFGRYH